jgi:polar amino acid transport system ATP-binding protein
MPDRAPESKTASKTLSETSGPIIEFSGVSKSYGALPVLRNIDLRIGKGEKVALMGYSGCGKTTLLRCINGLEQCNAGFLKVNGEELTRKGIDWTRFRSRIGMVFQQYNLFPHLTVLENIILGPVKVKKMDREQAIAKAHQLLAQVGIAEKAHIYPEHLSGGQKQRVAIARSLAMEPDILLLDEPTSALDPPMSREVLAVIEQVADQGMTLVLVTHELRFVAHMSDRLVFMDGGQVAEQGPPDVILKHPQVESTRRYLEIFEG